MNAVKITVLFAMMIGAALSDGVCSDVCQAPCNVALQGCQAMFNNNAQCQANYNICAAACANICQCDDQCEEQCRGPLDECLAANEGNVIAQANCNVQLNACVGSCESQCAISSQVNIIQGLLPV